MLWRCYHLSLLEKAKLIRSESDGRNRIYSIEYKRFELLRDWLAWFSEKSKKQTEK